MDFKLMENISAFQEAAKKYGLRNDELFQTVDLWKGTGINSVTKCVHALGRLVSMCEAIFPNRGGGITPSGE